MINQEQRPVSKMRRPARTDTFTLTFPRGEVAVLNVSGAPSFLHAIVLATEVLPGCKYTVAMGDRTNGSAKAFYTWWYQPQDEDQHHQQGVQQ